MNDQKLRVISLKPLYELVKQQADRDAVGEWNALDKEYRRAAAALTVSIDEVPGFYVWGHFDRRLYWHSTYLGKSGLGKTTHLRARIYEELIDERVFAWRLVHSEQEVLNICSKVFAARPVYQRLTAVYERAWKRAMQKYGATHIIWVTAPATLAAGNVLRVEADLIEALNPSKNIQRPTPPDSVQAEATEMFQGLRSTIHAVRRDQLEGGKRLTPEARWNRLFREALDNPNRKSVAQKAAK
jgi:hypothetical protein